jgi:hypothetical protein
MEETRKEKEVIKKMNGAREMSLPFSLFFVIFGTAR